MVLSAHVNKTKIAIVMVAFLFVASPLYFANAFLDGIVYDFVVWFFGGILGLCGVVLNYAVAHFVVGFGQEFNNTATFNMINTLWTLVRDFFNLTFIFGLVYLGFSMILNNDNANTRRWLVTLVIAALLVNFSLLISKVIIDVSNILATQIIVAGLESGPRPIFILNTEQTEVDFAGSMMQQMKVVSIFSSGGNTQVVATGESSDQSLGYSMMLMILFLVSAFTFFSAGLLLIIRGAMLMIFMVLSPFMFIGFVIPKLKNKAQEYWTQFLGRAFFAPIYMMMMYISLSVFQAINGANNIKFSDGFNANGFADQETLASTFGPLVLLIVLMTASLTVAKQLGVDGAAKAVSAGTSLRKFGQRRAGAATFGAGARLGRNTVGAGAAKLSDSKTLKAWATKKGVSGMMGRAAMGASLKTANSSFDARNVGGMGKSLGIGTGRKGGYTSVQSEKEKKHKAMMDHIGTRDMDDKDNKKEAAEREKEIREKSTAAEALANKQVEILENFRGFAPAKIEEEIVKLDTSIASLNTWLAANKDNPAIDDYQKQKVREDIITQTNAKAFASQALGVSERRKARKEEADRTLAQAVALETIDPIQSRILNDKAKAIEDSLDNESKNLVNQAKYQARKAELERNGAKATAENEVKYKDQIAYMEALEAVAEFQKGMGRKFTGKEGLASGAASGGASATIVSGSVVAGAAAGAVGAAGAATAGWVFRGMGQMDENIAGSLRKKYGKDANAMAKSSAEAKELKKLKAAMEDAEPKAEENKDDSSTS